MGRTFLVFNLNINTIDNVDPILLSTMCTTVLNSNQMGNNFANWQHNVVIYKRATCDMGSPMHTPIMFTRCNGMCFTINMFSLLSTQVNVNPCDAPCHTSHVHPSHPTHLCVMLSQQVGGWEQGYARQYSISSRRTAFLRTIWYSSHAVITNLGGLNMVSSLQVM